MLQKEKSTGQINGKKMKNTKLIAAGGSNVIAWSSLLRTRGKLRLRNSMKCKKRKEHDLLHFARW
jgi:hypothetical protein